MPQTLSTTSATWLKDTGRFFTRGRSQALRDVDTAYANYETAKQHGWNSQQAEEQSSRAGCVPPGALGSGGELVRTCQAGRRNASEVAQEFHGASR